MNTIQKLLMIVSLVVGLGACAQNAAKTETSKPGASLEEIVQGKHRSDKNKARDQYRHPVETLKFFEVEPNMTVVEISPGGGWYTEILGPYLKDQGKLILAVFDDATKVEYRQRLNKELREKVQKQPKVYGKVEFAVFDVPEKMGPLAPEGTVDRVLTFRNLHNWMSAGKLDESFRVFHAALKPGGILGVVEHRADPKSKRDPKAESGYVHEAHVIEVAKKAGFELVAKSEINANPKDTRNHPKGVWTLPPSLRLGDQDREKYLAIGESDRMTLKFRKK